MKQAIKRVGATWCRMFHKKITRPVLGNNCIRYHCLSCQRLWEVRW